MYEVNGQTEDESLCHIKITYLIQNFGQKLCLRNYHYAAAKGPGNHFEMRNLRIIWTRSNTTHSQSGVKVRVRSAMPCVNAWKKVDFMGWAVLLQVSPKVCVSRFSKVHTHSQPR